MLLKVYIILNKGFWFIIISLIYIRLYINEIYKYLLLL